MAIYHYHTEPLSRARGRSAVGAAAYRAGVRLRDQRRARWYDFRSRRGVAASGIALPPGSPLWLRDRSALWNHAEHVETRANARVAREVRVALPRALNLKEQAGLVQGFVRDEFTCRGLIVDWHIHLDKPYNPHAHLLVTVRSATAQGLGSKERLLDRRDWLLRQRKAWAAALNRALAAAGVGERVDHRSLKVRGLTRPPTPHLSRAALALERRGVATVPGRAWRRRPVPSSSAPPRPVWPGTVRALFHTKNGVRKAAVVEAGHCGRLEKALNHGRRFKPVLRAEAPEYVGRYRGRDRYTGWLLLETASAYVAANGGVGRRVPHALLRLRRGVRRAAGAWSYAPETLRDRARTPGREFR